MPVGNHKKTFVLILHPDPVVERAHIISQVQFPGRAHATEHALTQCGGRYHGCSTSLITRAPERLRANSQVCSIMQSIDDTTMQAADFEPKAHAHFSSTSSHAL